MNTLLLFFAFPVATIILSIVLQKLLRSTFLTAATFFAIFLIVTFSAFDINFLVYTIAYTIISYITAVLTEFILKRNEENEINDSEENNCCCNRNTSNDEINNMENIVNNNYIRSGYRFFRR